MKLFDVVRLREDLPEDGLVAGMEGTVVDVHTDPPACEVEFADDEGRTTALVAIRAEQLSLPAGE